MCYVARGYATMLKTVHRKSKKISAMLTMIALFLIIAACIAGALQNDVSQMEYPQKYSAYVEKYAVCYQLPPHLIYAVIRTESGFDSGAVSSAGAMGLMQIMPDTFRWLSDEMLREQLPDGMVKDPETNIRYGCYYLRRLYDRYGHWSTALAAYNAGPTRVDRWLEDPALVDQNGSLIAEKIPDPYGETRHYVPAVLAAMAKYDELYPQKISNTKGE